MIRILLGKVLCRFKPSNIILNFAVLANMRANNRYIKQLLSTGKPILLEIGAGPKKGKNGWVTADIRNGADCTINLLEIFPFPNDTVDKIYSSHVLEHFSTKQLEFILSECRRVLKTGGIISVCVPNAQKYINAYNNPEAFNSEEICRYKPAFIFYSKIDYINYMAYMGGSHSHMFDEENLIEMLRRNGFQRVQSRKFDPELDKLTRDYESIYAQGEK